MMPNEQELTNIQATIDEIGVLLTKLQGQLRPLDLEDSGVKVALKEAKGAMLMLKNKRRPAARIS